MEEKIEDTKTEVNVDVIAALAGIKPEEQKEPLKGKKPKKGKEKKPPTPEEISVAVASVVLAEMKSWPEEVVALIGEQHPNKENFPKGVPYVIGAYMHFAREALNARRDARKREAEVKTARLLGPVSTELQRLRKERKDSIEQACKDLEAERKKRIQEATKAIDREINARIAEVRGQEPGEEIQKLNGRELLIQEAYEGACKKIDIEANELLEDIRIIDAGKDDWNSKDRKSRRAANKETVQEEPKAVE